MGERRVHFVLFCKGKRDTSATPNFGKACQNLVFSILLLKGTFFLPRHRPHNLHNSFSVKVQVLVLEHISQLVA